MWSEIAARSPRSPVNGSHEFETGSSSAARVTATASGGSPQVGVEVLEPQHVGVEHRRRDAVDAEAGDAVHPRCALHRDDLPGVRISRVPEASPSSAS